MHRLVSLWVVWRGRVKMCRVPFPTFRQVMTCVGDACISCEVEGCRAEGGV